MRGLIYRDLNGRPRLRRVVAALLILGAVGALAVWTRRGADKDKTPIAVQPSTPEEALAAAPAGTPTSTPTPGLAVCPVDPADWRFVEVFPGDHYQRIEPACVYAGLEKTAAWMLMARLGYSKTTASDRLGLASLPWSPVLSIEGYTNLKGPMDLTLAPEWPAHPDFHFWQVDRDGQPAVALSLRGCYRAPSSYGSVICVLALDRSPGSAVSVLDEHRFASHAAHLPGSRTFQLLGYGGEGHWRLLGQLDGLNLEIENLTQMAGERKSMSERLGTVPWDAAWLAEAFGVRTSPLPEDWRLLDMDVESVAAIADALNAYIPLSLEISDE